MLRDKETKNYMMWQKPKQKVCILLIKAFLEPKITKRGREAPSLQLSGHIFRGIFFGVFFNNFYKGLFFLCDQAFLIFFSFFCYGFCLLFFFFQVFFFFFFFFFPQVQQVLFLLSLSVVCQHHLCRLRLGFLVRSFGWFQ